MSGSLASSEFQSTVGMLLDALPQPALLVSTSRRVLAANREFQSRFGTCDLENRPFCYRLLHAQEQSCSLSGQDCPLERSWQSGKPTRSLHIHSSADRARHVCVEVHPITDECGHIDSFLQFLTPVEIARTQPSDTGLVGRSRAFNRMLEQIQRVARTSSCVLVTGEPGAGKESVARSIHAASRRAGYPFIPVDCSSLSEPLFEREAFGHVRGAFPGADEDRFGLVGGAEGGTLFLDEVSDLPRALQARILRLIETRLYRPEGSPRAVTADIRVISSSDKHLDALVQEGRFRHDLLTTLSTLQVHVPPLRDRTEDIPLLAESLIERLGHMAEGRSIHPSTFEVLRAYWFPGNIRELHTILERALLLADEDTLRPKHLPEECRSAYARGLASPTDRVEGGSESQDPDAGVN